MSEAQPDHDNASFSLMPDRGHDPMVLDGAAAYYGDAGTADEDDDGVLLCIRDIMGSDFLDRHDPSSAPFPPADDASEGAHAVLDAMSTEATTPTPAHGSERPPLPDPRPANESMADAYDALLATCGPKTSVCKPATMAIVRAPMIHAMLLELAERGVVDPGRGRRPFSSLVDLCRLEPRLVPHTVLEYGVKGWIAGRLMEVVRPGSARGVPVAPLSRIGSIVNREFEAEKRGGIIVQRLEAIDAWFVAPERDSIRRKLGWMVDSVWTVAAVRVRLAAQSLAARYAQQHQQQQALKRQATAKEALESSEAVPEIEAPPSPPPLPPVPVRPAEPTGKDYSNGPIPFLKQYPEAFNDPDLARNEAVWEEFLTTRAKESEANRLKKSSSSHSTTNPAKAGQRHAGAKAASSSSSKGKAPQPSAALPPNAAAARKGPVAGTIDGSGLFDRDAMTRACDVGLAVLADMRARNQSTPNGEPIYFEAPSITHPGRMVLTCWAPFVPVPMAGQSVAAPAPVAWPHNPAYSSTMPVMHPYGPPAAPTTVLYGNMPEGTVSYLPSVQQPTMERARSPAKKRRTDDDVHASDLAYDWAAGVLQSTHATFDAKEGFGTATEVRDGDSTVTTLASGFVVPQPLASEHDQSAHGFFSAMLGRPEHAACFGKADAQDAIPHMNLDDLLLSENSRHGDDVWESFLRSEGELTHA
jgi:hypothetical protein